MLQFLQSVFASRPERSGRYDRELIEAATERVVDGTDPRLRSISGYQTRLRDPVERSVDYIIGLVDALPAAIDMQPSRYGLDPYLRAFFASRQHLEEVIDSSRTLVDFVRNHTGPVPQAIFCGFGVEYEERRVLGVQMRGDMMERDVAQTAVNFGGHRLVTPADNEADARWELKKRGFDNLITTALQHLVSTRSRNSDLQQQRDLLRQKLRVLNKGNLALEPALASEADDHPKIAELEKQLAEIESELLRLGAGRQTLDDSLSEIVAVLGQPEEHLWVTPIELRMNQMGLKLDPDAAEPAIELHLTQVGTSTGLRRCVMVVQVPPPKPRDTGDFLKEASRYLG